MNAEILDCLDWVVPRDTARLAPYLRAVERAGVGIEALWVYTCPHGRPKMAALSRDDEALRAALAEASVEPNLTRCLFVTWEQLQTPFSDLVGSLAAAGIPVRCCDFIPADGRIAAILWVPDKDLIRAQKLLLEAGAPRQTQSA